MNYESKCGKKEIKNCNTENQIIKWQKAARKNEKRLDKIIRDAKILFES